MQTRINFGYFLGVQLPVANSELWILFPAEPLENNEIGKGLSEPLLLNDEEKQSNEDDDEEGDGSEEAQEKSHEAATSIASAYRLLTPSVKV